MNNYFESSNLGFVATCLLLRRCSVAKVYFHPNKEAVKVFCLEPKEEAENIYKSYISDAIKVPPQLLTSKIYEVRHYPAQFSEKYVKP